MSPSVTSWPSQTLSAGWHHSHPPQLHLHLCAASTFAEVSELEGLIQSAARLWIVFSVPFRARATLARLIGSQHRLRSPRGGLLLPSASMRAAALRLMETPLGQQCALVADPLSPLDNIRDDNGPWMRLLRGNTLTFTAFHDIVRASGWVLQVNHAKVACIYSHQDLSPHFTGVPRIGSLDLPGQRSPRSGPPVPADLPDRAERVDLSGSGVTDLRPLLVQDELKTLIVDDCPWLDTRTIAQLSGLTALSMRRTWVEDLSFLAPLPALAQLTIDTPPVQGWMELLRLPQLRTVQLPSVQLPQHVEEALRAAGVTISTAT